VFVDVPESAKVNREEIFGPVRQDFVFPAMIVDLEYFLSGRSHPYV
jgi:hypothetical protein